MEAKFKIPWFKIPENWISLLLPAGIVAGIVLLGFGPAIFGHLNSLLQQLILFTTNLAVLAAEIIIGALAVFFVMDNWTTLFYMYRNLCRGLTRLVAEYDPIGTINEHLAGLKRQLVKADEAIQKVRAVFKRLNAVIAQKTREIGDEWKKAAYADQQKELMQRQRFANRAVRRERSVVEFTEMKKMVELALRALVKYREVAQFHIEDTEDEVQALTEKFDLANAVSGALSAFKKIFGGGKDKEIREIAARSIAHRYEMAQAGLENMTMMIQGLVESYDAESGMADKEFMNRFDRWKNESDALMTAEEKKALISATEDETNVLDPDAPIQNRRATATSYDDLFRNR